MQAQISLSWMSAKLLHWIVTLLYSLTFLNIGMKQFFVVYKTGKSYTQFSHKFGLTNLEGVITNITWKLIKVMFNNGSKDELWCPSTRKQAEVTGPRDKWKWHMTHISHCCDNCKSNNNKSLRHFISIYAYKTYNYNSKIHFLKRKKQIFLLQIYFF